MEELESTIAMFPDVSKTTFTLLALSADFVVISEVAFTFDDGPYLYTSALLDKLKAYNAKATFFISE